MDIEAYIASGILEEYVLGNLSAEEQGAVQLMVETHPEVAAELEAVQKAMEAYVQANAVTPPSSVKAKLLASLEKEDDVEPIGQKPPTTTIPNSSRLWKGVAAAAIALLLLAGAGYFKVRQDRKKLQQERLAEAPIMDSLKQEIQALELLVEASATTPDLGPGQLIALQAAPGGDPQLNAKVAWYPTSGVLYLSPGNLPALTIDKQYQLWAIVEGQPVDLGTFNADLPKVMIPLKGVAEAQTFAITVEVTGGAAQPTLEAMLLVGEV